MAKFNSSNDVELADVAALIAYAVLPSANDRIQLADGSGSYYFSQGSSATADGNYIVDQTAATALGRWKKVVTVKAVASATVTLEDTLSGEISDKSDYAFVGANLTDFTNFAITSALPDGIILHYIGASGTDLVRIQYENQTGSIVTGQSVDVKMMAV